MRTRIKERFKEMMTYLGRDTKGVEMLKLLKDDVNELRKSLAAAEEAVKQAEVSKLVVSQRAEAAETELANVKLEACNLRQQITSLTGKLNAALKDMEEATDPEEDEEDLEKDADTCLLEMKSAVKRLRKIVRWRPKPDSHCKTTFSGTTEVFNRESLSKGWSHNSLWLLGASIAVTVELCGTVIVKSSRSVGFYTNAALDRHPGVAKAMICWVSGDTVNELIEKKYQKKLNTRDINGALGVKHLNAEIIDLSGEEQREQK